MHPLFGRRLWLAAYALAWLAAGVPLAALLRAILPLPLPLPLPWAFAYAVPLAVAYGFAVLAAWWICRQQPLDEARIGRVISAQLSAAWQVALVWGVAGALWGLALNSLQPVHVTLRTIAFAASALVVAGVPVYLLSAALHYLGLALEASRESERRLLESRIGAREAELRALRAQLNPHFLFNSLNSINALVGSDPEGARRMCEGLGDFLRRTLALGARADVALGEELELVERYLAIERVRFGERLGFTRDCPAALLACRVPPLLLQPLIENAVKHGVSARIEGGTIVFVARRAGDDLVLTIENPVDDDAPSRPGSNLGLANVQRRLDALGAESAQLAAESDGERFRVTLTLPAVHFDAGEEDDA